MRIWVGDTCDKRGFVDYLSDTYAKKPIAVCETRNLYNTVIRNFTVANDPHSNKFESAVGTIRGLISNFIKTIPHEIIIFDDWFTEADVNDIDYFVTHSEADVDAILRVAEPDSDGMKKRQRAIEQLARLKTLAPDKVLIIEYHERIRDLFDIVEEGDMGVQLSLKTALVSQRHFTPKDLKSDRLEAARLLGGTYGERKARESAAAEAARGGGEPEARRPGIVLRTAGGGGKEDLRNRGRRGAGQPARGADSNRDGLHPDKENPEQGSQIPG